MLAVQYLEPGPDTAAIEASAARARLRAACERLPIACVILGWDLPEALVRACVEEAARAEAQLFAWRPLLAGGAAFAPRPEWQTIGLDGTRVPGFRGLPEFTFLCPNRPAAAEALLERLRREVRGGPFQGVFLDRIRYPSPAGDPSRELACFCEDCRRAAAAEEFDLEAAQRQLQALFAAPGRVTAAVQVLLDPGLRDDASGDLEILRGFLDFRTRSITRFVQAAAGVARSEGLAVGLDCFSPAPAPMVGQDLTALGAHANWIKVMTYGHALGPAGLPYELLGLARWLVGRGAAREDQALAALAQAARLPLPASFAALAARGLSPDALAAETRRARAAGVDTVLAGIELVDLEGVTRLDPAQILADLRAFREAAPDGLVLSWDLWRIPLDRLEAVRIAWFASPAEE